MTGPPVIKNVNLNSAANACRYDLHFTTVSTGCSGSATLTIAWGDRYDTTNLSHAQYSVTMSSGTQTRNAPTDPNTPWTFNGLNPPASGLGPVDLTWSWQDTNNNDKWRGQSCKNGGNNPCSGSGTQPVQRMFTGADNTTGPLKLLQLATAGVGTGAALNDTGGVASTLTFNLNVGLQAEFKPDTTTTSPLTSLRQSTTQGNQSLNCNTQNQGDDFQEYANGCTMFYSTNTAALTDTPASPVTDNPWWQGTPHSCPDGNAIWALRTVQVTPFCVAPRRDHLWTRSPVPWRTARATGPVGRRTTTAALAI